MKALLIPLRVEVKSELGPELVKAFDAVTNERIRFLPWIVRSVFETKGESAGIDQPGPISRVQDALLGTADRAYRTRNLSVNPADRATVAYENNDYPISLRFMMQLAATKHFVSETEFRANVEKISSELVSPKEFNLLIEFLVAEFSRVSHLERNFEPLFSEYATAGEVHFGTEWRLKSLARDTEDAEMVKVLKELVEKYRKPTQIHPVRFSAVIRAWKI